MPLPNDKPTMRKKPDFSSYVKIIKTYWKIITPILVVMLWLGIRMIERQASLPDLFSYVPADAEQVLVNRPARNIGNAKQISLSEIPEWVKAQFQQISLMLMVQVGQATGDQMLLLDTNNDFSPQDFLATLNPQTEVTYSYKRLEDGRYLFAPKEIISVYTKPDEGESFFSPKSLSKFTDIYKSYSMTMVSRNKTALGLPAQFNKIFANVDYVIMAVDSKNSNISFVSHVIFHKANAFSGDDFKPEFTDNLKASTMAYLEFGPIASWIPAPQLDTSLTGDNLVQNAVIWELTQQLFRQHTALIFSKWSNATNLWITIAAANPALFTKLKPWMPTLGQWLKNQEWLSWSTFAPVETEKKIWYMITLQEGQQIWFLLEQDDKQAALRIGNPLLDGSSSQKLLYNDHSLATLDVDVDQVLSIYKQFVNMGIQTDLNAQDTLSAQLKGKSLRATISADEYGLWLEWEIK